MYQVAKAFIYQGSHLLLQLRDNNPDIYYPNYWGLFGGEIDPGETAECAIAREIEEELGWQPPDLEFLFLWEGTHPDCLTRIFAAPLTVPIHQLNLTEGQALKLFTLEETMRLPTVPDLHETLPQAVPMIKSPELQLAWKVLSEQRT
ncbi:NUDIX hydrolase [Lusitaniella coriacea LEGE 07157]|uniref:NUDIX hydrolase n=1 Tax=Lusitaniella coriacea LEGE 07157 TaxID=945747 RepID=A0A8J7DYP3_9CYAN|nr:NUDIX hydrolase [Lusitaniella coriacea]MBE9116853.1 NUDIX hydrolase [Lusitaniella coriacea LEGE 07157]